MDRHRTTVDSRSIRAQRLGPTVMTMAIFALMASLLGVLISGFLRVSSPGGDSPIAQDPESNHAGPEATDSAATAVATPDVSTTASATPANDEASADESTSSPAERRDFLALHKPVEVDGAIQDGSAVEAVAFSGNLHDFAIWTKPAEDRGTAQISYMLEGQFATLRGIAGISDVDEQTSTASTIDSPSGMFRIYGDGNLLWKSNTLAGFGAAQDFEVDVSGIEMIALVAETETTARDSSFAWGDVELLAADTSR